MTRGVTLRGRRAVVMICALAAPTVLGCDGVLRSQTLRDGAVVGSDVAFGDVVVVIPDVPYDAQPRDAQPWDSGIPTDAPRDVPVDVARDAARDAGSDTGGDAGAEAGADGGADVANEAAVDAAVDAANDAAADGAGDVRG